MPAKERPSRELAKRDAAHSPRAGPTSLPLCDCDTYVMLRRPGARPLTGAGVPLIRINVLSTP